MPLRYRPALALASRCRLQCGELCISCRTFARPREGASCEARPPTSPPRHHQPIGFAPRRGVQLLERGRVIKRQRGLAFWDRSATRRKGPASLISVALFGLRGRSRSDLRHDTSHIGGGGRKLAVPSPSPLVVGESLYYSPIFPPDHELVLHMHIKERLSSCEE